MKSLSVGQRIVVYDGKKVELGEGTFLSQQLHPDLDLTVYECEEHHILAKGSHWLRVAGELIQMPAARDLDLQR